MVRMLSMPCFMPLFGPKAIGKLLIFVVLVWLLGIRHKVGVESSFFISRVGTGLNFLLLLSHLWSKCRAQNNNTTNGPTMFHFPIADDEMRQLNIRRCKKAVLHRPGIEPGPPAWQASILPLNQRCSHNDCNQNNKYIIISYGTGSASLRMLWHLEKNRRFCLCPILIRWCPGLAFGTQSLLPPFPLNIFAIYCHR